MGNNATTTLCRLRRGAFWVTGVYVPWQYGQGFFDITITDQDVEVTASFSAVRFKSKARLSVQDLGMGFWCVLHQAHLARLDYRVFHSELFPGALPNSGWNIYITFRKVREKIIAMEITGDDIPVVMREVATKYDLEVTEHG